MSIFDINVKFDDVPEDCGPEPTLRKIIFDYYFEAFTLEEATSLTNRYIEQLSKLNAKNLL
ncbi:hypothetical protein [Xanthomonas phage DES1]|nr:hypothetical protein [Xanthomonas phage DES1]